MLDMSTYLKAKVDPNGEESRAVLLVMLARAMHLLDDYGKIKPEMLVQSRNESEQLIVSTLAAGNRFLYECRETLKERMDDEEYGYTELNLDFPLFERLDELLLDRDASDLQDPALRMKVVRAINDWHANKNDLLRAHLAGHRAAQA